MAGHAIGMYLFQMALASTPIVKSLIGKS
jgi:hypothetical protein